MIPPLPTLPVPDLPRAACAEVDPDLWFSDDRHRTVVARQFCAGCPELDPCLEYAIGDPSLLGLWGGTTTRERMALRRLPLTARRKDIA